MIKKTGFHGRTSQLTEKFVNKSGFFIPQEYTSAQEEYLNVRNNVGVIDLSYLPKIEILGPDAETLCQTVFTRDIKKLGFKSVTYTAMLNEEGGMIDDGTLFRMCQNTFRFICRFPETIVHISKIAKEMKLKVIVKEATENYNNIAIQGPNSRAVLKKIVWTTADNTGVSVLKPFNFAPARLDFDAGTAIVVSRTGYSGELGYEILMPPSNAEEVWDSVFDAGKEFGIKPFGLYALDLLRIESGLIFTGKDFDGTLTPKEAGIGFVAPLSQPDDFIGKSALIKRNENP